MNISIQCAQWRATCLSLRDTQLEWVRKNRGNPELQASVRIGVRIARNANQQALHWGRIARGVA